MIGQIGLLCIDEVHTLGDDRGAVLEAVVSRMRAVATSIEVGEKGWPASRLRTIAVSATCPNLNDVGRWIGACEYSEAQQGKSFHLMSAAANVGLNEADRMSCRRSLPHAAIHCQSTYYLILLQWPPASILSATTTDQ